MAAPATARAGGQGRVGHAAMLSRARAGWLGAWALQAAALTRAAGGPGQSQWHILGIQLGAPTCIGDDVAVSKHRALGNPRGAACVVDQRHVRRLQQWRGPAGSMAGPSMCSIQYAFKRALRWLCAKRLLLLLHADAVLATVCAAPHNAPRRHDLQGAVRRPHKHTPWAGGGAWDACSPAPAGGPG
jgi:hypothetical protein